ncbi:MAG: mechanosensitive ion channel domain-containing protein [Pseudomonadota bacterium]
MDIFEKAFLGIWPLALIIAIGAGIAWLINRFVKNRTDSSSNLLYPALNWANISAVVIAFIIMLPINEQTRGQVLSLLGVVITAVIALSSTTFVANAMAGVMLQTTKPFRPGDYIRVNDQFGRVIKRNMVNTQIQTEWRDLTTLPNLLLVNSPVNVLHREGTIIFAEISIGYDVPFTRVDELMTRAAADAGLEEPFVLVHELLDHAVAYRVCGFLPSIKSLLSSRSNLRKTVLTQMHGHGIEVVSPTYMNQRQLDPKNKVIPDVPVLHGSAAENSVSQAPEDKIFDMALEAESLDTLKSELEKTRTAIKESRAAVKEADSAEGEKLEASASRLERKEKWLQSAIHKREKKE